ncbi:11112_t:CDS:2, partial [Acaulospora morrowiae]
SCRVENGIYPPALNAKLHIIMALTEKPNIVILGGGYAGVNIAIKLEAALHKTHQIILVE